MWWMLAATAVAAQPTTPPGPEPLPSFVPPMRAPADAPDVPGRLLRDTGRGLLIAAPAMVGVGTGLWVMGRWLSFHDPGLGEGLQVAGFASWGVALGAAAAAPPVFWVAGDQARQAGARTSIAQRNWSIGLYATGAGLVGIGAIGLVAPGMGPGHPLTWTLAAAPFVGLASLVVGQVYAEVGVRQLRFGLAPLVGRDELGLSVSGTF